MWWGWGLNEFLNWGRIVCVYHYIFSYLGTRTLQIYLVHIGWGLPMARYVTEDPYIQLVIYFAGSLIVAEIIYQITTPIVKLTKKQN